MDFKKIQEDAKAEVVKNWRVIAIVAGGVFVLAIIIGLTTKKDEPEMVRQEANRKTDVTRIYMNAMDKIDEEPPQILLEMTDDEEANSVNKKAKVIKKNKVKKVNKKKEIPADKNDAGNVVLPHQFKK